jgi:hypothetical protein
MIRMSPEFERFSATPVAERKPTFVNNCQTKKGRELALKLGPTLLLALTQNYEFPSPTEVGKEQMGDCFISSTTAFVSLLQRYGLRELQLVTGTFRHPGHDEVIFHCWLDCCGVVFNMSNMPLMPMYSIEFVHYRKHNSLSRVIQRINARDLSKCFDKLGKKGYKDGDVFPASELLNILLGKTFSLQEKYFDRRQYA